MPKQVTDLFGKVFLTCDARSSENEREQVGAFVGAEDGHFDEVRVEGGGNFGATAGEQGAGARAIEEEGTCIGGIHNVIENYENFFVADETAKGRGARIEIGQAA